jgi:rhodanese-related sulfurtransferase
MRSAQMCQWLAQQGFTNVINIAGGIDAYSNLVDASVPRY